MINTLEIYSSLSSFILYSTAEQQIHNAHRHHEEENCSRFRHHGKLVHGCKNACVQLSVYIANFDHILGISVIWVIQVIRQSGFYT